MEAEHLTAAQCDELAEALLQDAAALPDGSEREKNLFEAGSGLSRPREHETYRSSQGKLASRHLPTSPYWHLADMPILPLDVCCRGWTGHAVQAGQLPLRTRNGHSV